MNHGLSGRVGPIGSFHHFKRVQLRQRRRLYGCFALCNCDCYENEIAIFVDTFYGLWFLVTSIYGRFKLLCWFIMLTFFIMELAAAEMPRPRSLWRELKIGWFRWLCWFIMSRILLVVLRVLIVLLSMLGVSRPKLVYWGCSEAMLSKCWRCWCC